jgi:hypothetical protein
MSPLMPGTALFRASRDQQGKGRWQQEGAK